MVPKMLQNGRLSHYFASVSRSCHSTRLADVIYKFHTWVSHNRSENLPYYIQDTNEVCIRIQPPTEWTLLNTPAPQLIPITSPLIHIRRIRRNNSCSNSMLVTPSVITQLGLPAPENPSIRVLFIAENLSGKPLSVEMCVGGGVPI